MAYQGLRVNAAEMVYHCMFHQRKDCLVCNMTVFDQDGERLCSYGLEHYIPCPYKELHQ